ncbi:imidazole glycerol phosphate synthase subunit HisH [Candidatus Pelagibacter giovannonii]|uniref:Imidazole glycerol phosphate synthase subunit HisH n=1 Tax=Candidatus Pelagibacter giovannonii TaxID=2563896 RepID=A0A6H1Q1X7_9PROT|nr:imidazole glycerol phosphate synthase subunit HisH [Candidatus Pelagibacter giovannonii]QIZ20828.1 imidazole glycerol phosphate synthase subunit HisH [Candidatus Pelagibacter giovannonii]
MIDRNEKIGIVDYGMSNSFSVISMVNRLGRNAKILKDTSEISTEKKFILPGVGNFDNAILNLKRLGWFDFFRAIDFKKKYYLFGFCVGMQVLFSKSEEGKEDGLSLLEGEVLSLKKLQNDKNIKIPAMGWKKVNFIKNNKIINNIDDETSFYFVHSYFCLPKDPNIIIGRSNHGHDYATIISENNIYGTQFHTEKSHKNGMHLMKNFLDL